MIYLGFFKEMALYRDSGSVQEHLVDSVDYDKQKVIDYLSNQKAIARCPKYAIDCVTGKNIDTNFTVHNDGEYEWCNFLIYHIEKYNIKLPKEFIKKIGA